MAEKVNNAQTFPEVYYGLHFSAGLAEYRDGDRIDRILIEEETIKNMNPSFVGKPVYVKHVDEVNLANIQNEADGYVTDSFYNPADGKCWCKFIVVSDAGKQAIRNGWKLSNAYKPLTKSSGGTWHGMDYSEEITSAEYEHLAIVPDPRYEESMILNSEEFKKYNEEKQVELKRLANSKDEPKGEKKMALNFFKRTKVENSVDIESTVVELPKSKKEYTIAQLIVNADKIENMAGYASDEHMVKVGENEMSVGELKKKHEECMNELADLKMKKDAISEDGGEPGKGADDDMENSEESVAEDMADVGDRGGDESLKKNEEKEEEMKKEEIKKKVNALKNAGAKYQPEAPQVILNADKVALGKSRYGSN